MSYLYHEGQSASGAREGTSETRLLEIDRVEKRLLIMVRILCLERLSYAFLVRHLEIF